MSNETFEFAFKLKRSLQAKALALTPDAKASPLSNTIASGAKLALDAVVASLEEALQQEMEDRRKSPGRIFIETPKSH